ncbi:MAG TPA: sulfotransferase domain-containing protein [Candidatus Binataceae bacterium]|jgi:hypothetical protein|nr:sulfotransferase domain-containing protein [Candidatus Binataceae bacterium]
MIDFLCIGPTRTGTTWLHDRLSDTLSLPGPHVKETKFFDLNFKKGIAWYESHMRTVPGAPRGEFGPNYFHSHLARKRIAKLVPKCIIIAILREPVARLFSLYRMKLAFGTMRESFEDALLFNDEFLSSTRYAFNLAAWAWLFSPAQIHVLFYDSLLLNRSRFLADFCSLLGLDPPKLSDNVLQERVNDSARWRRSLFPPATHLAAELAWKFRFSKLSVVPRLMRRVRFSNLSTTFGEPLPEINPDLAARARNLLAGEFDALERLLNIDLAEWREGRQLTAYMKPVAMASSRMLTTHQPACVWHKTSPDITTRLAADSAD